VDKGQKVMIFRRCPKFEFRS